MFDDFVKASTQIGHRTVVYTRGGHGEPFGRIVGLFLFPFTALFSLRSYKNISRIAHEEHPDVAVVFNLFPFLSISALMALRNHHIPVILYIPNYRLFPAFGAGNIFNFKAVTTKHYLQDFGIFRVRDLVYALLACCYRIVDMRRLVTHVLVPSKYMKERFAATGGFPQEHVSIIEHYSAKEAFASAHELSNIRSRLSLIYVGRLASEKGVDVILRALNGLDHVSVTIVGDGPQRQNLIQLTQRLHLQNVRFVGQKLGKQKWNLIQKSDVCIVPSVWPEPFGLFAAEAMAMGKCVVASRSGALPGLISDHVSGILFEAGNWKDLAAKLQWLTHHRDVVKSIGQHARYTARQRFTQTVFRSTLRLFYKTMTKSKALHVPGGNIRRVFGRIQRPTSS